MAMIVLTKRERQILPLIADGHSNKIIADLLGISDHAAKFHVANIARKIQARSRAHIVTLACRLRLLDPERPSESPMLGSSSASDPVPLTFAGLKAQLDLLSSDQLAKEVVWCGEDRGGRVFKLWVADEDWIGTEDGDCEPRSLVALRDPDDAASAQIVIPKGTPQLLVDP